MQISRQDTWTLAFKTKNTTLSVSKAVHIDSVVINGPGEYDVAGISVQGMKIGAQTVYVMNVEDMRICVVPLEPVELLSSQLETIGSIDIAVVPAITARPITETFSMVNLLEPQMVIIIGDGDVSSVKTTNGVLDTIKVTKASLPTEERETVLLKPAKP